METLRRMIVVTGLLGLVLAVLMVFAVNAALAADGEGADKADATKQINRDNENYYMAVVLGAALAAGFGFLGGGYAVARVGAAALGAASERPELLTRSIVLVALGEGIAVFGFVVAIVMLGYLPG